MNWSNTIFSFIILLLPFLLYLGLKDYVKMDYKQNPNDYGYNYAIIIGAITLVWWNVIRPYINKKVR
jgi:hypothetical protein